jgi:pyruvate formate lyase activating enzyme
MDEIPDYKNILNQYTTEGVLYSSLEENQVRCFACGHQCRIQNNHEGICKVRYNKDGVLFAPTGYISAIHPDPIEKKPFYHVFPGSITLSFGMLGCDYKCSFCQNWNISQTLRDESAISEIKLISASKIVELARNSQSRIITSTYNEPLITTEWAVEVFKEAAKCGIKGAYVSNGNANPEVLKYIRPYVYFYKVDLKSFSEKNYQKLGGRLKVVLDTIQNLFKMNFWVEVVTLIIPDYNDSEKELTEIANFVASVSKDIPWHVTAFHKNYQMYDRSNTTVNHLLKAVKIGNNAGLRYVYAGNIPGQVKNYENTYCPECNNLLVSRVGFSIKQNILKNGQCPKCNFKIPGFWS